MGSDPDLNRGRHTPHEASGEVSATLTTVTDLRSYPYPRIYKMSAYRELPDEPVDWSLFYCRSSR